MNAKVSDSYMPSPERRARSPDWVLVLVCLITFGAAGFGAQLVLAGISEGYCIIWPSIGTRFAPAFSESGFGRIQPGMTREEVHAILGEPLGKGFVRPAPPGMAIWQRGDETWQYAQDSSARGGDWAWLSREVSFRNGVVVQTISWIYRD